MNSAKTVSWLTNMVIGIAEFIIGVRILLKLAGASTFAPFVRWEYNSSSILLSPFVGMFPSSSLAGGSVIDFSALFALIVYAFVGYLIFETLRFIRFHSNRLTTKEKGDQKTEQNSQDTEDEL